MADVNVTWLGDEDPSVQVIEQYGHTFVKGEPTKVDAKDEALKKLEGNRFFSTKKADPVKSAEPEPVDPDKGTEIEAVRKELDALGIEYDGRNGLETLRGKLAAAKKEA